MACERNLRPMRFPGRSDFNCLYVGKGPSLIHATPHLDWGDVAVVNEAGDHTMLGNRRTVATFLDGARQPHAANQDTDWIVKPRRPLTNDNLRQADLYQWEHEHLIDDDAIAAAIRYREPTYFESPGPSGVLFLWLRGYRRIWLFGHDGGKGVTEGFDDGDFDYSNRRVAMETMIPLLAAEGCEVKFWPEVF